MLTRAVRAPRPAMPRWPLPSCADAEGWGLGVVSPGPQIPAGPPQHRFIRFPQLRTSWGRPSDTRPMQAANRSHQHL